MSNDNKRKIELANPYRELLADLQCLPLIDAGACDIYEHPEWGWCVDKGLVYEGGTGHWPEVKVGDYIAVRIVTQRIHAPLNPKHPVVQQRQSWVLGQVVAMKSPNPGYSVLQCIKLVKGWSQPPGYDIGTP